MSEPCQKFIGGYELDPTQPAMCQVCGHHSSAHTMTAVPKPTVGLGSMTLRDIIAWRLHLEGRGPKPEAKKS